MRERYCCPIKLKLKQIRKSQRKAQNIRISTIFTRSRINRKLEAIPLMRKQIFMVLFIQLKLFISPIGNLALSASISHACNI